VVDLALSSLALVIFSRTQQQPPALTEASLRYYQLLRVAQNRIAQLAAPNLDELSIEACLLAVSLMSRYEVATLSLGDLKLADHLTACQTSIHYDGVKAILKVWNDNFSHNPPTFIVTQTRRELLKSSMLRNLPVPDWMQDGSRFGEHGLELEYDHIIVRVVNLHYSATRLPQQGDLLISEAAKLNSEARELDEALQDWSTRIPGAFLHKKHVMTDRIPWPRRHFYSPIVYSYPKPGFASAWCQCFTMRIVINSTRYKVLELCQMDPVVELTYEQQQHECSIRLGTIADNLAYSIPFCLERAKVHEHLTSQPSVILNTSKEIKPYLARLVI
jgi:hypothetical protein